MRKDALNSVGNHCTIVGLKPRVKGSSASFCHVTGEWGDFVINDIVSM
jgi:hypothetical protein